MKTGSARQKELREKRKADGIGRAVIWLSDNDRDALAERFPGPKGGIDWQAAITAALNFPASPAGPAEPLPDNKTTPASPKPTPLHDNEAVVSYRVHGIDAARRCQAKNRSGDRCRDAGTMIRTEVIDGRRCEFDACQRHGKAEFFTPHPSVIARGPTT
jgi:hypothetical protein